MRQIKNIEELRKQIDKGNHEFYISLGPIRSSKFIDRSKYNADHFYVYNESDNSEQTLTEAQMLDRGYTNIGHAMKRGAFFTKK